MSSGHWTLSLVDGKLFIHSQEDYVLDQFLELFSFWDDSKGNGGVDDHDDDDDDADVGDGGAGVDVQW